MTPLNNRRDCTLSDPQDGAHRVRALQQPTLKGTGTLSGTGKTGLATIMRDWMQSRSGTKAARRFTIAQLCDALCVPTADAHQKVANALYDFVARGEVVIAESPKHNRRQPEPVRVARHFLYVIDWQTVLKGKINRKIFKAMYVSHSFSVSDILRLTGISERNFIDKLVRRLKDGGHIQPISRRRCVHSAGTESVYHVVHRDKFKLEVMR